MKYTLMQVSSRKPALKQVTFISGSLEDLGMYKVSHHSSGQKGTSELTVQVYLFPSFYGTTICIFEFKVCGM